MNILFLATLLSTSLFALVNPDQIQCQSNAKFTTEGEGKTVGYQSGFHKIRLRETVVLTVFNGQKKIAQLYPQYGMHGNLVNKTQYREETDNRSYWRLLTRTGLAVLSCELDYE